MTHFQDVLSLGRQVLATQTFSVHMGLELTALSEAGAVMQLPVKAEFRQHHGYVHGGVLSFLADCALAYVGSTAVGPNVVTGGFTIDYVRPARGELLLARSVVLSASKRQAVCRCEVYSLENAQEGLCALAQGTIVAVGAERPATDKA